MGCFVQGVKSVCDVLSRVEEMAWNVLFRVTNFCVMFCPGLQNGMGCFVQGVKSVCDVLSRV